MWRRRSKRQSPEASDGAPPRSAQPRVVTLRPMTEAEYTSLRAFMDEDYARDVSQAMGISIEEARAAAAKQLSDLLKDGLATEGHYLWKVVADQDGAVGDLWTKVDRARHKAFIYFIGMDEQHRGKGYGRAAMLALEATVRPMDVDHIDLNVFGDNATAIHLYESLGYRPTAINMRKEL